MVAMVQIYPLQILIASLAGLMNRRQGEVLEYLIEENHVLEHRPLSVAYRLAFERKRSHREAPRTCVHASEAIVLVSGVGPNRRSLPG